MRFFENPAMQLPVKVVVKHNFVETLLTYTYMLHVVTVKFYSCVSQMTYRRTCRRTTYRDIPIMHTCTQPFKDDQSRE